MRIFSFGGGVQSTACLILAAQGKIDFPTFVFANVGEDSERKETLEYIRSYSKPFAEAHGIKFVEVSKTQTLYANLVGDNRTIAIPVYLVNEETGKPGGPGNRKCTSDWKIKPIARYCRQHGATKKNPAVVGIGISTDEWHRAKESRQSYQKHEFPLLDLNLRRSDCTEIIKQAGLPPAPKSACWFCPYTKPRQWQEMATFDPETFLEAVALESKMRAKKQRLGLKLDFFLSRAGKPLDEAFIPHEQLKLSLDLDDECSGYCWT